MPDQTSIISKTRSMYNPLWDNGVSYDNYLGQLTYFPENVGQVPQASFSRSELVG